MTAASKELLEAVLKLPESQRILIAEKLVESVPPGAVTIQGVNDEQSFLDELRRRSREMEGGEDTYSWDEVNRLLAEDLERLT